MEIQEPGAISQFIEILRATIPEAPAFVRIPQASINQSLVPSSVSKQSGQRTRTENPLGLFDHEHFQRKLEQDERSMDPNGVDQYRNFAHSLAQQMAVTMIESLANQKKEGPQLSGTVLLSRLRGMAQQSVASFQYYLAQRPLLSNFALQDHIRKARDRCRKEYVRIETEKRKKEGFTQLPQLLSADQLAPGQRIYANIQGDKSYKCNFLSSYGLQFTADMLPSEYERHIVTILNFLISRTCYYERNLNTDRWHFGKKNKIEYGSVGGTAMHQTYDNIVTYVESLFPMGTPLIKHELRLSMSVEVKRAIMSWINHLRLTIIHYDKQSEQMYVSDSGKEGGRRLSKEDLTFISRELRKAKQQFYKGAWQYNVVGLVEQSLLQASQLKVGLPQGQQIDEVLTYYVSDACNRAMISQLKSLLQCLLSAETAFNSAHQQPSLRLIDFYVPEILRMELYCPEELFFEAVLNATQKYDYLKAEERSDILHKDFLLDLNPRNLKYLVQTVIRLTKEDNRLLERTQVTILKSAQLLLGDSLEECLQCPSLILVNIFNLLGGYNYVAYRDKYEGVCRNDFNKLTSIKPIVSPSGRLVVDNYLPFEASSQQPSCSFCRRLLKKSFEHILLNFQSRQGNQEYLCFLCAFSRLDQQQRGRFQHRYFSKITQQELLQEGQSNSISYVLVISNILPCGLYRALVYGSEWRETKHPDSIVRELYFMETFTTQTDSLLASSAEIGPLLSKQDLQPLELYRLRMPIETALYEPSIQNQRVLKHQSREIRQQPVSYFEDEGVRYIIDYSSLSVQKLVQHDELAAFMKFENISSLADFKTKTSVTCFTPHLSRFDFVNLFASSLQQISLCCSLKRLLLNQKFKKLRALSLSDILLQVLDMQGEGSPVLEYLEIKSTDLSRIGFTTNPEMPKLRQLKIFQNKKFNDATFLASQTFPSLETVVITNGSLNSIAIANWKMKSLKTLDLSDNSLSILQANWETKLPQLASMKLDDNYLECLDLTLCELKSLKSLSVSNNRLRKVLLPALPSLKTLDLSFNYLEMLDLNQIRMSATETKRTLNVYFSYNNIKILQLQEYLMPLIKSLDAFMNEGFVPHNALWDKCSLENRQYSIGITYQYLQWTLNNQAINLTDREQLLEYPNLQDYVEWERTDNGYSVRERRDFDNQDYKSKLSNRLRELNKHFGKPAKQG